MAKRYKCIFGNPPYSMRSGNNDGKNLLWNKFSETSMKMADEVYYVTPYIWHQAAKKMIAEDKITKIDLTATDEFTVGSSICYWNNHKRDKKEIHTKNKIIQIDRLRDIEYLPCDTENTLSIHKKMWDNKYRMGFKGNPKIDLRDIHDKKDETNKYPIFYTSGDKIKYVDERNIRIYGLDLFYTPKVMVGFTKDNRPFFDREGGYASSGLSYYLTDTIENLEVRMKQLTSNLAQFYFITARQEMGDDISAIGMYRKAFRLFPDIPLTITDNGEIYRYFALTDDEVDIVEGYNTKINIR